jgi:hypothetical protein
MPSWINLNSEAIGTYDVIHVDGRHSEECINNDMLNSDKLVKLNGIIIIDDTNSRCINSCVNRYISSGRYEEVNVANTFGYPHRVIIEIK